MSFLKNIIRKKEKPVEISADFGLIGTDMHSHFIPGIDDGAENLEQSIALIRGMKEFGYKKIITTPHIYSDFYPNTPKIILDGLAKVREELARQYISINIEAAAEYYADEYFEAAIEQKTLLTFGKNHVLFEISFAEEPPNLGRIIFNLQMQGYKPILAHPERYDYWHNDFSKYESLIDKDVRIQININSLTANYGPDTRRIAEKLIHSGMVSFIGSDCHHNEHLSLMQTAAKNPYLLKLIESGKLLNDSL